MSRNLRISLACLGLPLALALASCGEGTTTVTPSSPTGSSSGAVTTTPTPTPAPTPTATPTALKCELPERPDCGASCCFEGGGNPYVGVINDAQAELERTRPDLFETNGSLKVDEVTYTRILAEKITAMTGICAVGGGLGSSRSKDEVGLKRDNNSSTNVDVIIGSTNRPDILGVYTCRPAAF
ncbi:MAG: hypothetical protein K1Y01_02040 [Vicinamibacteria bacterium]|nr:hypothetical protein [Vicinamibacteria bacterium]